MTSLRRTTVLSMALLLAVVGVVGAGAAYLSARNEANDFLDLQQQQIARYVGDVSAASDGADTLPPHDSEDDYVIEITYRGGQAGQISNPEVRIPEASATGFSEFTDAVGGWRVFSLVTPTRTVQVAQQLAVRHEVAAAAALQAAIPLIVAVPLSWLLLELVVARIFGRTSRVAEDVAARNVNDTSPIPVVHVPTEVLPLVQAMNLLLERLRSEMARQRTFLSNAAHELRTPLTALILQIGNLRNATTDPALAEQLEELQAGAHRATTMTVQLLRIARYDTVDGLATPEAVRLAELLTEVVAGLVPLADDRGVDLGIVDLDPATVRGSAAEFRTLLEVLVENALRYTPSAGTVDVCLWLRMQGPTLVVRDSGPGVPTHLLPRLTERFFRGPNFDTEGTGLGLAIAKAIADRHGVTLTLVNVDPGPGFVATLTFPRLIGS